LEKETAWNQILDTPITYPALAGKELIDLAAKYFGAQSNDTVQNKLKKAFEYYVCLVRRSYRTTVERYSV
jgi:hypothetical protein